MTYFYIQLTPEATCILEPGSRMKVTFYIELVISLKLNRQLKISDVKKLRRKNTYFTFL